MLILPTLPLNPQGAHVADSDICLIQVLISFSKSFSLPLAFWTSAWQADIHFRDLLAIISKSFQSGDSLFSTTTTLGKLPEFPQFALLCICCVISAAAVIPVMWRCIDFLQSTLALQNLHNTIFTAFPVLPAASINESKQKKQPIKGQSIKLALNSSI